MSQTYNANANLKARGVQIEYTAEQLQEYIRCSKDPIYFITHYVKIINLDKGLVDFNLFPYQANLIRTLTDNRFVVAKCPRQCGKDLDVNTVIPTPDGSKLLSEIKIGDQVFSEDGTPTTVIDTVEFTDNPCYRITFDTGEEIVAGEGHLWKVDRNGYWAEPKTLTTKELVEIQKTIKPKSAPLRIKATEPLQFPEAQLPIDPYVLGVWLGDGNSGDSRLTLAEEDGLELLPHFEAAGFAVSIKNYQEGKARRFQLYGLYSLLRTNNLLNNKHIPDVYLRASIQQRLALLKGLMDTDGSCRLNKTQNGGGSCEFYNKNRQLIQSVRTLLSSLGIKNRIREKWINGEVYYSISFATSLSVFRLKRKQERQYILKHHPKNDYHYISSIEPIASVPTKCLSVDHPSHMFLCGESMIPTHNSTTLIAFLLHQILFTSELQVAILANKEKTARELLGRLKLAYEHLPKWLQQGVEEWNKSSIILENNSKVIAAATSGPAIRGLSINMLLLDEFAFLPNNIANDFFTSVYPTISSGENSKIFIVSTPKGMNLFYNIWTDAQNGKNAYVPFGVHWSDWPGHDDKWRLQTIANMGADGVKKFSQEYECEFLGSTNTLISDTKLATLTSLNPISSRDGLDVFYAVKKDHTYIACVDVSKGVEADYHAITVIDVTEYPYKMVAKWRSNTLSPLRLPDMIFFIANAYNEAFVLIENNIGSDVAQSLHDDLEYENILMTTRKAGAGQMIGGGYGGAVRKGVEMDKKVKAHGCAYLKALIESDKLIIHDHDTIMELRRFISQKGSYSAEAGANDDLAITLVMFAWLINQRYFKDLMDQDIQAALRADQEQLIEDDLLPFGFRDDGKDTRPPEFNQRDRPAERFVI